MIHSSTYVAVSHLELLQRTRSLGFLLDSFVNSFDLLNKLISVEGDIVFLYLAHHLWHNSVISSAPRCAGRGSQVRQTLIFLFLIL